METNTVTADMEASRNALRALLLKQGKGEATAGAFPRSHLMGLLLNPVYRKVIVAAVAGLVVLVTKGRSRADAPGRWTDMAAQLAAAVSGMRGK